LVNTHAPGSPDDDEGDDNESDDGLNARDGTQDVECAKHIFYH
jgi:hypothetical protein